MSPTNLATPFYEDGDELTGFCTANVTGKHFVKISGARQLGGPNLVAGAITDSIAGGNVSVAPAVAGDKVFGVAVYDQLSGNLVPIYRSPKVVPVTAGAAIAAGAEVQSDANGAAITLAAGKAVGLCLDAAASGADAQIALYP
jgi:hypothetical protein